jgi:hypothetical protein
MGCPSFFPFIYHTRTDFVKEGVESQKKKKDENDKKNRALSLISSVIRNGRVYR